MIGEYISNRKNLNVLEPSTVLSISTASASMKPRDITWKPSVSEERLRGFLY
jgi:hypothetical protein